MKLNRYIPLATLLFAAAGAASAEVSIHGSVDYTTYGAEQSFTKTDGEAEHTKASSGYDPDSNYKIDLKATAQNVEFNLGLYFNSDGNDEEYYDYSDNLHTPFYQGNIRVGFVDDQVRFYTGKFEDFNAGYIEDGYALGTQSITNLADKTFGQYLTGLEFAPRVVKGLKFFAGLPVLPYRGNGVEENFEANQWKNIYKKAKYMASYTLPIELPVTLNAGFRGETHYDGTEDYRADSSVERSTNDYMTNYFGEGFFQAVLPDVSGVALQASYDIRWRDSEYSKTDGTTKEHKAFMHMATVGAEFGGLISDYVQLAAEDRFYYAGDDYIHSDEKLIYDILAVTGEVKIAASPFSVGGVLAGMYAVDARGTAFSDDGGAKVSSESCFDSDVGMSLADMTTASVDGLTGKSTTYMGCYANPYVKVNLPNGYLKAGVEFNYTLFKNDDIENQGMSYRIPVGIIYNF